MRVSFKGLDITEKVNVIGTVVLVVVVVGCVITGILTMRDTQARRADLADGIASEQALVDTLSSEVATGSDDSSSAGTSSAAVAGQAIALWQNSKDGQSAENTSSVGRSVTDVDARYGAGMGETWASGLAGVWSFGSTYAFDGDTVRVAWLMRTSDGTLLAYATATYDTSTSTFSGLVVTRTEAAASHPSTTSGVTK